MNRKELTELYNFHKQHANGTELSPDGDAISTAIFIMAIAIAEAANELAGAIGSLEKKEF